MAIELLKNRFDFIFYTGSSAIGQKIHSAAAAHLTPTCLELGGKSPVYIHDSILGLDANESADSNGIAAPSSGTIGEQSSLQSSRAPLGNIEVTAKRILWGKLVNAGQTCVAPDYILCSESVRDELIEACKRVMAKFYGSNDAESKDMCRIINSAHYQRLINLLSKTKGKKIKLGYGDACAEEKFIPLTLVTDVSLDDVVMREEIFGPILPIITVKNHEEAIQIIRSRDNPLTLYIFTKSMRIVDEFLLKTSSGSVCVNDDVIQMILDSLPFGGVGGSGFGSYHGYHSFKCFSHSKSVLIRNFNPILEWVASKRYPPYCDNHLYRLLRLLRKRQFFQFLSMVPFKLLLVFILGLFYGFILTLVTEDWL